MKITTFIAVLIASINVSFAQTVHTYNFNYEDKSIGQFKLITTDLLYDSLSCSKDSVFLTDSTMLATVKFYNASNRLSTDQSYISNYSFTVHPNPFTKSFEINYKTNVEENAKIKIFDALGRKIITQDLYIQIGTNHYEVDLTAYKSGIFFVTITAGKYQESKRVVKN